MGFKNEAPIIIFTLYGVELSIDISGYGLEYSSDECFHMISGELFYCDLLIDGKILVTETFLNGFIKKYALKLNIVKDNIIYTTISTKSLNKLRKEKFDVKFLTIDNFVPDTDEINDLNDEEEEYIFTLKEDEGLFT